MAKKSAPTARVAPKRFELLTLGNELLLGRTPNAHLAFIGDQLARRGVVLAASTVVPDEVDAIATAFARSWARSSVVITTGGLGPTSDDVTREAIAEALGQKLVFDKAVEKTIAARFETLGRKMTANNLKQAWRPEGAELLPNPFGTAPGLLVEQDGKMLFLLPGPPNELEPMWRNEVLPRLVRRKLLGRAEPFVQLRTAGVGESALETRLQPLLAKHPGVAVAYCAHAWAVDLRFSWSDGAASEAEARQLAEAAAGLLGDDVFTVGSDSLAEAVADLLRLEEKTLAVAESGSGGQLASVFTDLPGASKFFQGGVVVYRNAGKVILLDVPESLLNQHGAISAEAAVAMASGVSEKLVADYGLSIACCAGPGACCDGKAAGATFVGLHAPEGVWCRRLDFPGTAAAVRARSINSALDWLRRELLKARRARLAATPVKPAAARAHGRPARAAKAK